MKSIIIITVFLLTSVAYTQNLQEWTRQKKTQIKYLVSQIAALDVYTSFVKEGFDIAQKGLNVVDDLKNEELSLHTQYFSSLKNINSKIALYGKVADIISIEKQIEKSYNRQINIIHADTQLTSGEKSYCHGVFQNLLNKSVFIIEQLTQILTPGALTLTDNERLKRIDELHNDIEDKYSFQQHFYNCINQLAIRRFAQGNDIKTSIVLFNLN